MLGTGLDILGLWGKAATRSQRLEEQVKRLKADLEFEKARSADKDRRLTLLSRFARHRQELAACDEAEIIGQAAAPNAGIVFIDRGARDRVEPGMTAVAGHTIVGRVDAVGPVASSVRLITASGSRFDGKISRTGEPGVVIGAGQGTMTMEYVSEQKPRVNDAVVARGRDGITPKHFVLGVVTHATRPPGALRYDVTLRPIHRLDRLPAVVPVKPVISADDFPEVRGGEAGDE
jgi:cell shape-determining protein MreC